MAPVFALQAFFVFSFLFANSQRAGAIRLLNKKLLLTAEGTWCGNHGGCIVECNCHWYERCYPVWPEGHKAGHPGSQVQNRSAGDIAADAQHALLGLNRNKSSSGGNCFWSPFVTVSLCVLGFFALAFILLSTRTIILMSSVERLHRKKGRNINQRRNSSFKRQSNLTDDTHFSSADATGEQSTSTGSQASRFGAGSPESSSACADYIIRSDDLSGSAHGM